MNNPHLLSNMSVVDAWIDAISQSLESIKTYVKEIGTKRMDIYNAIQSINLDYPEFNLQDPSLVFILFDILDENTTKLIQLSKLLRDPNTLRELTNGMSRTYSENLKSMGHTIKIKINVVKNLQHQIKDLNVQFSDKQQLIEAYGNSSKNPTTTAIYVKSLMCLGDLVELDNAKNTALNAVDHKLQKKYHPLQVLASIVPGSILQSESIIGEDVIDISCPTAKLSIKYDIAPLINKKAALKYGSIVSQLSGLNYKLVERLRTIDAVPKMEFAQNMELPEVIPDLKVSMGNKIVYDMRFNKKWHSDSGISSRVKQYSKLSEKIILNQIKSDQDIGWNVEIKKRFEDSISSSIIKLGVCGDDALISELMMSFEARYDLSPPEFIEDFQDMVSPKIFNPDSYISKAISKLQFDIVEAKLKMLHIKPAAVRIPHDIAVKEARTSMLISVLAASQIVWKRIREIIKGKHIDVFEITTDPYNRKTLLMKEFRKIITTAVMIDPVPCLPPTLKMFAAAESKIQLK